MKAVIYCRVSTEMQAEEELPILSQVNECKAYAESKGWEIAQIYKDEGYSGRTDDRPAFQEMFTAAKLKPKPFDIILTWRSNRLFRNVEYRLAYSRLFRRYGVKLESLHEPEFEGATGRFMETVLAAADELYRNQVSEDTLRGLKQIARQGYSTGGRPPTGYRNKRVVAGMKPNGEPIMRTAWEPDINISPKVKKAFEMCAEGKTNVEIVQATKIVSAKNGLSTLLRNRAYLGERIYNTTEPADKKTVRLKNPDSEWVVVLNSHPAIVSQELFDKVQAVLDRKKPKRPGRQLISPRDYILSGLLWCKEHQCTYAGHTTGTNCYYACALRKKLGKRLIPCPWLKKEAIERFILNNLKSQIFTREVIRQGLKQLQEEEARNKREDDTEVNDIRQKMSQIDIELERIRKAVLDGVREEFFTNDVNQRLEKKTQLDRRLTEIEAERQRALKLPEIGEATVNDMLGKVHAMLELTDPRELKIALSHFIDRIEISGNEVSIFYSVAKPVTQIVPVTGDPGGI